MRKYWRHVGLLAFIFVFFCFVIPQGGFATDIESWSRWAKGILQNGLGRAYQVQDLNYNPLYLYILWFFAQIQGSSERIDANIQYLKVLTLVFDFAGVYLTMIIFQRYKIDPMKALFILFNIAYLFNTLIWGQVDAIHTTLFLFAFVFAIEGKVVWSTILYVLALNMKLQSIIFAPLLLLVLAPHFLSRKTTIIQAIVAGVIVETLILFPFIINGDIERVIRINTGAVDVYPFASMSAFNLWYLLLEGNPMGIPDALQFAGISYRRWGLGLFATMSAIILAPVLGVVARKFMSKARYTVHDITTLLLGASMTGLVFFFFNTQMHERYLHPSLIFCGLYAFLSRHYLMYILLSVGYTLNLRSVLYSLGNYTTPTGILHSPEFVAVILLVCLILGIAHLYKDSIILTMIRDARNDPARPHDQDRSLVQPPSAR